MFMSGPKLARHALSPALFMAFAFALNPIAVNAEVLSITPLVSEVDTSLQLNSGAIRHASKVDTGHETVAYGDDFHWSSTSAQLGSIKYLAHINTDMNGTPTLEAAGQVYSSTDGMLGYRFSNQGATPLTLPAGSIEWTLSSNSGVLRLPSTRDIPSAATARLSHSEGISFGFSSEIANADMDAGQVAFTITHRAQGTTSNLYAYSGSKQAWVQDEAVYSENQYFPDEPQYIPIGKLSVGSVERGISLEMSLTSTEAISISPGTSRVFFVMAGSSVTILPEAIADESNFPYVFKDASHSARLGLILPAGISVQGTEALPWVITQVPEPTSSALLLVGLAVLSIVRRQARLYRHGARLASLQCGSAQP